MWRVVLIDDDSDFRSLTKALLDGDGHFEVCAEAADGLEAQLVVEAQHPDVVLLDLNMPTMGGLDALPAVRQACPEAAIVIVSGSVSPGEVEAAHASGASGTLRKEASYPGRLVPYLESLLST